MAPAHAGGDERNVHDEIHMVRGDVAQAFARADHVVAGEYRTGAQEHLYLETQGVVAVPEAGGGVKGKQSPTMTLLSKKQVPECNYYIELGWIYRIPEPNPHIFEHVHDYDEIISNVFCEYVRQTLGIGGL